MEQSVNELYTLLRYIKTADKSDAQKERFKLYVKRLEDCINAEDLLLEQQKSLFCDIESNMRRFLRFLADKRRS
jgi:hypothetical protein